MKIGNQWLWIKHKPACLYMGHLSQLCLTYTVFQSMTERGIHTLSNTLLPPKGCYWWLCWVSFGSRCGSQKNTHSPHCFFFYKVFFSYFSKGAVWQCADENSFLHVSSMASNKVPNCWSTAEIVGNINILYLLLIATLCFDPLQWFCGTFNVKTHVGDICFLI